MDDTMSSPLGKIVPLTGGGEKDPLAEAVRALRKNAALMIEHVELTANIRRAKYLSLIEAGFTKDEALELCKASAF